MKIQSIILYVLFFSIGIIVLPIHIANADTCTCEINYNTRLCNQDNINFPFNKIITFDGSSNGISIWDIMRRYLSEGYPNVCDDTSNIMKKFFLAEFEKKIDLECNATNNGITRKLDICFVVDSYNGNEPNIQTRTTNIREDLSDGSCIKNFRGDVLRGCSGQIPDTIVYNDIITNIFYVGDHNDCRLSLSDTDTTYSNIEYSITCPPTPQNQAETQNQVQTDLGIPFSIPSTDSIRVGTARSLPELIGRGLQLFTGFFGSIALIMIVYGGVQIMTAQGQSDKINEGSKIIIWASIGLVTMILSYVLVNFVFGAIT
jgi:hypothetical protein